MNIETYPTEELARRAGAALGSILKEFAEEPLLLLCSGGSALKILEYVVFEEEDPFPESIVITVLDERFTNVEEDSNFVQLLKTTFFKEMDSRGALVIDPRPEKGEKLDVAAHRFGGYIGEWMKLNHSGKIVITQGMGADGHTAGIFPYPEDLMHFKDMFVDTDHLVTGYTVDPSKNEHTLRVTATLKFLIDYVDYSIAYISGEGKREALQRVLDNDEPYYKTPARVFSSIKNVTIFTDIAL